MAAQPSPTTANQNIQTIAVLPLSGTTVTATVPPSTSGVAVVDGTTLTFRHEGITLSDGEVFSLGFDGLVASTTTASYEYVSFSGSPSVRFDSTRHPMGTSVVVTETSSVLPPDTPLTATTSSSSGSGMGSTRASSSGSSSPTSSSASSSGTESSSGSMTTPASSTSGAQVGAGNTNAAPLTTNGGSGAPVQAPNVGFGGLFVAGLGLLVTFGAMVGL
ncbi:hypothetical protein PRZ48_011953 [Zasmidium cellare]|uniref:Uncharacterized protein n=1 Tax=Zasmidium cellare TaxID=395010 RepID=A0ABR0E7U6_ZASCE|nr:hypothetical protein PRZ48_011953 [Zasmidium cellare]